ncbi:MAG TPA: hypothetical protein VIJ79_01785 [Acidobacteriaceae bacterium]
MFKRSARYFTLALTLVALTATVRTARAQSTAPCTSCVVTGNDPQPSGNVVTGNDPQPSGNVIGTDDSQSMDDLISYLIILYGLA